MLSKSLILLFLLSLMIGTTNAQDKCGAGTLLYAKNQGITYVLLAEDGEWSSMGGECVKDDPIDAAARETYEETRESYLQEDLRKALSEDRSYQYDYVDDSGSPRYFKTYVVQAEWAEKNLISEHPLSEKNKNESFFKEKKKHVWIRYTLLKRIIESEDLSIEEFLKAEGRQSRNPTLLKNFALGLKVNLALVDSILNKVDNHDSLVVKLSTKLPVTKRQDADSLKNRLPPQDSTEVATKVGKGVSTGSKIALELVLNKPTLITDESEKEDKFKVALNIKPTSNVVIDISEEDDEGSICPKQLIFTRDNWDQSQEVTVTGIDDDKVDGDATYPISFLMDGVKSDQQVHVTNKDNDVDLADKDNLFYLEFNKSGQLLGSMDGHLSEDLLVGQIQISKAEYAKEVEDVLKEYLTALQNLKSNGKLYDAMGIENTTRESLEAYLLALIKIFVEDNAIYVDKSYYENWLTANYKPYATISQTVDTKFNYPRPEELLLNASSYQLELIFYDDKGIPLPSGKRVCGHCKDQLIVLNFKNKCGSDCNRYPIHLKTEEIPIPKEANSFDFFLRKKNSRFDQVGKSMKRASFSSVNDFAKEYDKNWIYLDSAFKQAQKYKPEATDANFKDNMIKWAAILNDTARKINPLYEALRRCYGRNTKDSTALANAMISASDKKSIMKYIKPMQKAHNEWITHWLWLNNGVPHVNPLAVYFNASSTSVTDLENDLEALKAEQHFLNKFIESENLSIDDFSVKYQAEKDSVKKLTKAIAELEQQIAKTKSGNTSDSALKSGRRSDDLLYKGLLKPNSQLLDNYQRNHDALLEYQLVGNYKNEITEIERMHVLIHNLTDKDNVDINFTNEAIDNDQSYFEDELMGLYKENVGPPKDPKNPKEGEMPPCNEEFIIKTYKEQVLVLTKWMENRTIMRTPPIGTRDVTPAYFSKEWKHTIPNVFASHVNYTITEGEGASKTTEFEGRYRMNKLYRFRLKAGLVQSWLKYEDYTVDDNTGEVTSEIERYSLTATAGIQIFWNRFDVRKRKVKFWSMDGLYSYVGLGLREEPFQNWLIGVGKEVTSGVGVMGGLHLGTTEKLNVSNGVITVEDNHFNYGGFASVIIDLSVFKQFFSLRNIDNPINSK